MKPGNAGRGKGPQFKTDARRSEGPGDWATYQLREAFRNCRRRCTRKRRQNPVTASTPSTTRSAARTFWRMPMPSAAPTRARRAWTVRDFEAVEACGVERWLDELALALGQKSYRPDPIQTRVHTEGQRQAQAAGHLQPCGIGSAWPAAMLVLEPIFEADPSIGTLRLPSGGETPNRRWSEWRELLLRGHPEVVDADLADYFGSGPHALSF